MTEAKNWAASIALFIATYGFVNALAYALNLRLAPTLFLIIIPLFIILSLHRARLKGKPIKDQWLNLRSAVPSGFLLAGLLLLVLNLSRIF